MTDPRRGAAPSDSSSGEDNPFAPPPEGQPDQPWQPRDPSDSQGGGESGSSSGGNGGSDGSGNGPETGGGSGSDGDSDSGRQKPSWGSKWSSRQPSRQSGGFGRPDNGDRDQGDGGQGNGPGGRGLRWDPRDPLQRHARYSLHAGIWALFFSLFSLPQIGLLLGALSLYWGINSLRGRKKQREGREGAEPSTGRRGKRGRTGASGPAASAEDVAGTDRSGEGADESDRGDSGTPPVKLAVGPAQAARAQTTAAVSGLVMAGLALCVVAGTFTIQLVYSDYYACQEDSLTTSSREECDRLIPDQLRPILENQP